MTDASKRPSLREAARRGAEANRQARAAQQPQQQPTAAPPVEPEGSAPRTEQVAARCGHLVPFQLHPDGKDKWRESRRKLVADRDCPECRKKAHEERQAAEMEAARQRRGGKPKGESRPTKAQERLPHGSRFDQLLWDAEKGLWSGTLMVPGPVGGEPAVFTASASGVFRLLRTLDGMYRAMLAPRS
jgi:hypothetical protein